MQRGISLAHKCLILFGCAATAILVGALIVPWVGSVTLVREFQVEVASQLADAWLQDRIALGTLRTSAGGSPQDESHIPDGVALSWIPASDIDPQADPDTFVSRAWVAFTANDPPQFLAETSDLGGEEVVRFAKPISASRLRALGDPSLTDFSAGVTSHAADPVRGLLLVTRGTQFGSALLERSRTVLVLTGLIAAFAAILVFWIILVRLIFSPVRRLRRVVDRIGSGDSAARANIHTGDEFETLATGFNSMLDRIDETQDHLRRMNENLDLKVNELAEANIGLWETSKFKSEFLANVSHELRTPLNSIIGFAELLHDDARANKDEKRLRYLDNIVNSGRGLLEMINELLDMAKIEAGRLEVHFEATSVGDIIEGITRIMEPQARSKSITLRVAVDDNIGTLQTDPGKVQQILYNLLSNAIKFTPESGTVDVSATLKTDRVQLQVSDTGPGIPDDLRDVIFEKFRQIESGHTRTHTGTGLGLAICKELAGMLHAELSVTSPSGAGAIFTLDLPLQQQQTRRRGLMEPADA
ncbi:MAG: HAMP domain-containing histidine kinase [Phycisphaerales bacterium]|nr:HAMP domain-containing histidine kinase [Phycisphaerales bacterium]